jgi:hypothetical protein
MNRFSHVKADKLRLPKRAICNTCKSLLIRDHDWKCWKCKYGKEPKINYVTGERNWDDVSLPICARKNGDGQCEHHQPARYPICK